VLAPDGVAPLPHYPFHSPNGFEWGFEGSGPADLARCILLHHFSVTPTPQRGDFYPPRPAELPVRYRDFEAQVIAALPRNRCWALTDTQVSAWVSRHR
jgi:hypothetical protein